nr:facilitated trehalose transporter Tret1-like isoform X1 [Procambarus clarkii]XP_045595880.1 facilitated trehalose transporter Tret1-like isoform X1 [Procambarus clarkii]XP_045595881.1 facilitated trehalose transporter Tret1-like isoform X1 [Procambarus clarkii]XP_045595882.1 facilitated trehalose transporter Tret1-like isoform X1 [Procambarus clarkii]XP_045595883.1 facilitated trehalose transporter Tret1-like isoform X1 [Procambarus clarkii]XP_045595884.1 facilitated trehalose transporter T
MEPERSAAQLVVEEEAWKRPAHGTQYFAALSASMGAMAVGAAIGYSSPASAAFRYDNTTDNNSTDGFYLSKEERGWFAGSLSIGALLGCVLAGFCINSLGRKGTMLASVVPLLGGWILIGLAQNLSMLIIGRILCGLCTGISSLVVPTYTTEYASKDIRGALGTGFQLFITVGILYAYVFGSVVSSWRWLTLVCGALGLVFLLMAAFLKESPHFLLSKGKEMQARQSMQYFRGKSYDIEQEMQELKQSLKDSSDVKVTLKDLSTPYILKPLLITLALMVFQQLSGTNAVIYNLNIIFEDSGSTLSDDMSSIIVGVVQVLATAASTLLIDRAGRKLLLSISAGVMAISIICLGVFFYMKSEDEQWAGTNLGWVPLVCLMVFITAFSIGYGPIPWIMMGELFYPNVKEAAGSLATTINWTCVFIVTFTFEPLQDAIHDYGAYFLFGSISALNFIFCLAFVPETKGKTLQETTAHFGGPSVLK